MLQKFVKLLSGTVLYRDLQFTSGTKNFKFGRMTFEDNDYCGQPVTFATEQTVAKVKCLIKGDPRITENDIFKNI